MGIEELQQQIKAAKENLLKSREFLPPQPQKNGKEAINVKDNQSEYVINNFIDECEKSPLWENDLTFLRMVLSTLTCAASEDEAWYKLKVAFYNSDGTTNCRTPVKQLIYTSK